mgnify:CR=1 FL=1
MHRGDTASTADDHPRDDVGPADFRPKADAVATEAKRTSTTLGADTLIGVLQVLAASREIARRSAPLASTHTT